MISKPRKKIIVSKPAKKNDNLKTTEKWHYEPCYHFNFSSRCLVHIFFARECHILLCFVVSTGSSFLRASLIVSNSLDRLIQIFRVHESQIFSISVSNSAQFSAPRECLILFCLVPNLFYFVRYQLKFPSLASDWLCVRSRIAPTVFSSRPWAPNSARFRCRHESSFSSWMQL